MCDTTTSILAPVQSRMAALVIAGPSGAGKSTLIEKLKTEFGTLISSSISYTTRAPRAGEEDGAAYYFVDQVPHPLQSGVAGVQVHLDLTESPNKSDAPPTCRL